MNALITIALLMAVGGSGAGVVALRDQLRRRAEVRRARAAIARTLTDQPSQQYMEELKHLVAQEIRKQREVSR